MSIRAFAARDSAANRATGWDLFDVDGTGLMEIQKLDESSSFATDKDALQYVEALAEMGSTRHKRALAAHRADVDALIAYRADALVKERAV